MKNKGVTRVTITQVRCWHVSWEPDDTNTFVVNYVIHQGRKRNSESMMWVGATDELGAFVEAKRRLERRGLKLTTK